MLLGLGVLAMDPLREGSPSCFRAARDQKFSAQFTNQNSLTMAAGYAEGIRRSRPGATLTGFLQKDVRLYKSHVLLFCQVPDISTVKRSIMKPTPQSYLKLLHTPARLDSVLDVLDELHSAASEGSLPDVSTLSEADLRGWLLEIMYLAQQTLEEIDAQQMEREPVSLSLVRKSS